MHIDEVMHTNLCLFMSYDCLFYLKRTYAGSAKMRLIHNLIATFNSYKETEHRISSTFGSI